VYKGGDANDKSPEGWLYCLTQVIPKGTKPQSGELRKRDYNLIFTKRGDVVSSLCICEDRNLI